MTKKKVILIVVLSLLILTIASIFAPVCVDKFFWRDNFEESVFDNNLEELEYLITKENVGSFKDATKNNKDGFFSYY